MRAVMRRLFPGIPLLVKDIQMTGTTNPSGQPAVAPFVSVILTCRCEAVHIREVLASILAQEPPEGGFEIVVADGMSEDGTREILAEMARSEPRIIVIDNPARLTSHGLNAAIRAASGQIVVRMDGHSVYAPDYLRQCVAVLLSNGADNVGGPWVAQANHYVGEAVAAAFQCSFAVGGARSHRPQYEGNVDTVYLGCWRKQAFERYGGFDERLVRNQDDEHNLRIIRHGGRIWQSPKIRSWYRPRTSLRGLFRQYLQYGYWKVEIIRKHGKPASFRHLVPGMFVSSLLLCCLMGGLGALSSPWLLANSMILLSCLLSAYAVGLAVASLQTARSTKWKFLPILPLVFCCYHFGYGIGFIQGVLDFLILRRGASVSMIGLTRESAGHNPPDLGQGPRNP